MLKWIVPVLIHAITTAPETATTMPVQSDEDRQSLVRYAQELAERREQIRTNPVLAKYLSQITREILFTCEGETGARCNTKKEYVKAFLGVLLRQYVEHNPSPAPQPTRPRWSFISKGHRDIELSRFEFNRILWSSML